MWVFDWLSDKTSKEGEAGKDANTEVKRKELVKSLKRLISRLSGTTSSSSLDPAEEETTRTSEETLRLSEDEVTPLSAKALREQLEELGEGRRQKSFALDFLSRCGARGS